MWGAYPNRSTSRGTRFLPTVVLSVLCMAIASPVGAKPNKRSQAAYKNGVEHFKRKSYGHAIESFERAYRYDRSPTLLFNIARAFEELGEYHAALLYFRKCRKKTPRAQKKARKEANQAIKRLEGIVQSRARGEASPANTATAPVEAASEELAGVMPVAPAQADPVHNEDAPPPILDEDAPLGSLLENPPPTPDYGRETWVWVTLGGGISLLAGAAFAGLEANERSDALDAIEAEPGKHSQREFVELQNEGDAWATATDLLLGSGLFAVGLASYFLFEQEITGYFAPTTAGEVVGVGFTF